MRILIIDDDPKILEFLKSNLEAECFAVDTASDGEQGSFMALTNGYDLIILDNELPKKSGVEVCQEIREKKQGVKIMMLSVLAEIPTKVELFNTGADDYMTKPFSFAELMVRIKALLRRSNMFVSDLIEIDDMVLDTKKGEIRRAGKELHLTRKEFMLLELMMRNVGRTVTQGDIIEHVWDMEVDSFSNTLKSHISNLRNKIDEGRKKSIIKTVNGRGYRIEV